MKRHPRVLLVNDSRDEREMYVEWLQLKGYLPLQAADAIEGFRLATLADPDIVVTDVRLPGDVDGLSLTRAIKSLPRRRPLPVVILTGCVFENQRQAALHAGCDRFLRKPCLPQSLTTHIDQVLRLCQAGQVTSASVGGWGCSASNGAAHHEAYRKASRRARN
jgi:CheY-like chemotaxis protein